jgi:hypothetical protein
VSSILWSVSWAIKRRTGRGIDDEAAKHAPGPAPGGAATELFQHKGAVVALTLMEALVRYYAVSYRRAAAITA